MIMNYYLVRVSSSEVHCVIEHTLSFFYKDG